MRAVCRVALRLVPALLLTFSLSGVPHVITTAFAVEDTCASDCDGSMGTEECPPTCTQGACAKVFAAVLSNAPPAWRRPSFAQPRVPFSVPEPVADPHLSPVLKGVFHPPRA